MRRLTPLALALALVVAGCGLGSGDGSDSAAASTSTTTTMMTATSNVTTTTIVSPSTTTMVPTTTTTTTALVPVFLSKEGTITTGQRDGETVFKLTHDVTRFADLEPNGDPNDILDSWGHRGAIWVKVDGIRRQAEIHRLWPPDKAIDVIWLTPRLTPSDSFTLFDALTLEGELDQFGLHADCRTPEGDVGVALLSFDDRTSNPLIAWEVDRETMSFVERDTEGVSPGGCLDVEPRE